jgi:hypothetical protein
MIKMQNAVVCQVCGEKGLPSMIKDGEKYTCTNCGVEYVAYPGRLVLTQWRWTKEKDDLILRLLGHEGIDEQDVMDALWRNGLRPSREE